MKRLSALAFVVAATASGCGGAGKEEVVVEQATLTPGQIVLRLVNDSGDSARVAQVIVNDAFVDFRQNKKAVAPGEAEQITLSYPWIAGESYDLELLTSTGATVGYEIEEAA